MPATKSGPTKPKCSDQEFMELVPIIGAKRFTEIYGGTERNVYARRRRIEEREGVMLTAPNRIPSNYPGCVPHELKNGEILVGSDFHIWPGEPSTCLVAFKKFVDDIKPSVVILNGDVMDFPAISRFPQNWEAAPDPQEEIEAAQDHLQDIVSRCRRGARKIWNIGNHDHRFELSIANALPRYRGIKGVHLADHFPIWEKAMSCYVNEYIEGGRTMIKHIPSGGGKYATRNYAANAGISTVHGHLHRQSVQCISDHRPYNVYGVDAGMVADKNHRAFGYTQNAPLDWREGFALLSYRDGILMPPELITKMDDRTVYFRGKLYGVANAKAKKETASRS